MSHTHQYLKLTVRSSNGTQNERDESGPLRFMHATHQSDSGLCSSSASPTPIVSTFTESASHAAHCFSSIAAARSLRERRWAARTHDALVALEGGSGGGAGPGGGNGAGPCGSGIVKLQFWRTPFAQRFQLSFSSACMQLECTTTSLAAHSMQSQQQFCRSFTFRYRCRAQGCEHTESMRHSLSHTRAHSFCMWPL